MEVTKEQIEKVAEWWAVRTFDHLLNQNNGDNSENGGLAFMLMNTASINAKAKAPSDARDRFKKALTANPNEYLDVDYHPSSALVDCCDLAGISPDMLPIKTFTTFRRSTNQFEGRYQYGGKFELIA